ncbi:hypothetical protein BC939DRAFT_335406 [Gamsiella multidivaricata]|uniref:uncharacterized protein n=1 Tax=Gamsiella multidivaricata TaxID=101098 RepID=UPI00221FB6F7|nr:uncharacterized protein BC939DRAFT_335406 [Gamsiella multidivaricata]KAI7817236.1 hypothetical protein BC939DRAFT_335406 [Gamsiella multidivaricata]
MDRMRIGDLGIGENVGSDQHLQEYLAQAAFLKGLIECLRLRDHDMVRYLVHEMIPRYWVEPVSEYPLALDEAVLIFGQAASELVLSAPVAYMDGSESTRSLILDLTTILEEYLPPAGLSGFVSDYAIAMLLKFVLMIFSIEFPEDLQHERIFSENLAISKDIQEASPRASVSTEHEPENLSRTPPRSPLSPKVSGEYFQARSMPPHDPNRTMGERSNPLLQRARSYFDALWENGHRDIITQQLKAEVENISFRRLVSLYHRVVLGSVNEMSSPILAATLNTFFNKLVAHQPEPSERLSRLLRQLSTVHRAAFYKPMIACVASDSTQFVTDYLCVLSCLEIHMGLVDLYMRDADMLSVIAMTDVGPERPRNDPHTQTLKWGSCTVGQCVIVLEFIYAIKRLARSGDKYQVEVGKMFLIDLERKLGLYLLSKEKKILVPRPMRVLQCRIFYEIRMLCKTIHRPGWLPRILDWAINYKAPAGAGNAKGGPYAIPETMRLRIKHIYSSVDSLVGERKDRYTVKVTNTTNHSNETNSNTTKGRESTTELSKTANVPAKSNVLLQPKRLSRMGDIRMDETVATLKLLITVHSAIQVSEYLKLIEPLWNVYLLESHPKVVSSAAFLFVKCADIAPKTIYSIISRDLSSEDPFKRLSTVERLSAIFEHRNELLLQPYVIDPSARGPFRAINVQVPFVSSEVGSNRYTMDEPRWLTELKSVGNFPVDIRNRFEELGWGERGRLEKEMMRRAQTPLMLSWTGYLDEDFENKTNFGRTHTVIPKDRHATVLVPVLNSLNMATIDLLDDSTVGVRSAAIDFLSNYIRNEPVVFVRWLLAEIVQAKPERQKALISRLHLLLSSSSKLPPGFSFALFNHLLGLLKWYQRSSRPLGMDMIEAVLPLLADIVSSTNDIVFKDLKRNKIDVFFSNLGRFWFRSNITPESMFPHGLSNTGNVLALLAVPRQLFQMTIINTNQIQFMTNFLVRFPLEAPDIKNSIGRFSRMPRLDASESAINPKLEDNQYLPDVFKVKTRFVTAMSLQDRGIRGLSSLRARAWLCFILNLIQRMQKDDAERLELMNIFNGVNVILLEHGDDLGIVGQALDIYITAATRLRRFFALQNGYMLIFPALFKIYCDSSTIRVVQDTIDAAFYRFYLLHQEAFVLQSLGAVVPLMLRNMSSQQADIMATCLFGFLEALHQPTTTYHSKALGVPSLAEPYHESSSYGGPQLAIPDWMSPFIPKDSKLFQSSNLLHKREFTIADSIKLFLAVIAFDPGSVRSEQFVRVLRQIMPFFLEREPQLMTSGLDSLIEAISKFARSSKPLLPQSFVPPPVVPRQTQDTEDGKCDVSRFALFPSPLAKNQAVKGKTWAQNDRVAIKHEFLCLIQLFCDRGGQLADSQHQQMAGLVRSIVKDYTSLKIPCTMEWVKDYIRSVILSAHSLQQGCRAMLYLVVQIAGFLRTHYKSIDFSGFLDGLLLVAEDDRRYLRGYPELAHVFHDRVVGPGLALAAKGHWITDSVHVSQAKFCSSLVDLILSMISNADMDTISELEQATPTPRFMAYVIVPMCLRFKTRFQSNCMDILEMQFWLRMLGLTVKAAEYYPALRRSSRTTGLFAPVLNAARVGRKRSSFDVSGPMSPQQLAPSVGLPLSASVMSQTPAQSRISPHAHKDDQPVDDQHHQPEHTMNASPGLLVDFIALRIIIVRAERYLSYYPGCWLDIFNIVKRYFSVHAHLTSSLLGQVTMKHGHQTSHGGSGPSSPSIATPFPATPRLDGPRTPDVRHTGGGLSPFPGFFRSTSDIIPVLGPNVAKENVPATALGYLLWTFAETILFSRVPLMIMMRPFLMDQLRLMKDHQSQALSARLGRSTNSSGPNFPAFYWPSPAAPPSGNSASGGSSPWMSPLHLRGDGGTNEGFHGRDSEIVGQQQRADRRKQWKSWSKPTHTMSAFTAIERPLQGLATSMSPHLYSAEHQHQHSFMSETSEQGGNVNATMPKTPRTQLRGHGRHHKTESEAKNAEDTLPKVLVDRANRSLAHVRAMLNTSSDGMTMATECGVPMYPEKRTALVSTGLSPSMARYTDRRDSSQFPNVGSSHNNEHQFLQPGKYERQPVSPGFGSMFLAREAALKAPALPLPDSAIQSPSAAQHSMTLTVPGTTPETNSRPTLNVITSSMGVSSPWSSSENASGGRSFILGNPPTALNQQAGEPSSPASAILTAVGIPCMPVKKNRSILKPRIITTAPPKADPSPQLQASAELPSASVQSPNPHTQHNVHLIRRMDSRNTEDGVSLVSGGIALGRRPSISSEEQENYRVACIHARTKIFIQNIEEETRIVLACFPSVFSIGYAPPPSATAAASGSVATAAIPVVPPTEMAAVTDEYQPTQHDGHQTEGASEVQPNNQARVSTSSLTVPSRTTPSITIQDQSYLAPSPIHPLPSALDGGEHLFRTSAHRPESEDVSPYRVGSSPHNVAKERRSKSVIFQRLPSMDNTAGVGSSTNNVPISTTYPAALVASEGRRSPARMSTPPILSITLSSPPPQLTSTVSAVSLSPSLLSSTSGLSGSSTNQGASRTLGYSSISISPVATVEEDEEEKEEKEEEKEEELDSSSSAPVQMTLPYKSRSSNAPDSQPSAIVGLGLNVDAGTEGSQKRNIP